VKKRKKGKEKRGCKKGGLGILTSAGDREWVWNTGGGKVPKEKNQET